MYRSTFVPELSRADFDAARLGFFHYLRRKRFSPQFIENHADDLFSTAAAEYTRKVCEGGSVENPVGFLIVCAWRRTKSFLDAESRTPQQISTERRPGLADEAAPSAEEVVLDEDRFRKVQVAVKGLSGDEQELLARAYFEEEAVREVARRLHWHPSKAQRCHRTARRRLHKLLGVDRLDDLEVEVGLAAYVSLAAEAPSGERVPGLSVLERVAQKATEGLASLKQQATTTYYRAVDPTPFAGMRPGTVAATLASCVAVTGGAATYCVEKGVDPIGAASGLIASTDEPEPPPLPPGDTEPPGPVYTPAEPPPGEESSPPEPTPPPAEQAPERQPEPEPEKAAPVSDNYEPVHTDYMAAAETEEDESYEGAPEEPAPVESAPQPAPVPSGAGPQFGGPGGP